MSTNVELIKLFLQSQLELNFLKKFSKTWKYQKNKLPRSRWRCYRELAQIHRNRSAIQNLLHPVSNDSIVPLVFCKLCLLPVSCHRALDAVRSPKNYPHHRSPRTPFLLARNDHLVVFVVRINFDCCCCCFRSMLGQLPVRPCEKLIFFFKIMR